MESGRWDVCFAVNIVEWPGGIVTPCEAKLRQQLDVLRQADVHWVMFGGINLWDRVQGRVEEIVANAAGIVREAGMRVSSFHCAGPTYSRPDLSQDRIVEKLIANVDLFAAFGMKSFVIHAGWIKPLQEELERLPDSKLKYGECERITLLHDDYVRRFGEDAVIATAARNLKAMARAAQTHGISLAFENMSDLMPLGEPRTLGRLVEGIDEPNVGYCLDSGHAWMRGHKPEELARWMGHRLHETHFHDCRSAPTPGYPPHENDEHLPVGFGTIDWRTLIKTLDEIQFPGPVTFETGGWPLPDAVTGYRRAIEWWRLSERMALHPRSH